MHILVTADTVGGVWTYTRELVTGLVRRGVRVTLVSFGGIPGSSQSTAQNAWLRDLSGVTYLPTSFRLEWMQDAERDLDESMRYLQGVIRESAPDLLHLSQYCYGALQVPQPKVVVAHSDVLSWHQEVHGTLPDTLPEGRWEAWYRGVVTRGLAGASLLVAPSRWMLQAIERCYGKPANSRVIYNGRTPELFRPLAVKDDYAASAGRLWDEGKQSSLLMRLENPLLPILVAGPTALAGQTETGPGMSSGQMSPEQLTPGVHCIGELSGEAMRELLARAAIYIATSKYEPFGLAPLEAALSHCAIIANDIPSLREIWEDAALYFRKDDAGSLGEALALLHGNPELRMAYAGRAHERACRCYSAGRMVDEYLREYSALLEARVRVA